MSNFHQYTPTTEPGQARRRVWRIVMDNPDPNEINASGPAITLFIEDRIHISDGSGRSASVGNYSFSINAERLAKAFPLIDLETGTVSGSGTGHQLRSLVDGFCLDLMRDLDAKEVA